MVQFIERSNRTNKEIGSTNDAATATRVRMAVRTVLAPKSGTAKPVVVVAVTPEFDLYRKKYSLQPIKVGDVFPSARAASLAVGAYLGGVSVLLSNARRNIVPTATIHGVTFKLKP